MKKKAIIAGAMYEASKDKSISPDSNSKQPSQLKIEDDVYDTLKKYHSALIVSSNMIKSFHYNVVGAGFYTIHPKLQELYEKIEEFIDETAETIIICERVPVKTLHEALTISEIDEYLFHGELYCREAMLAVEEVLTYMCNITKELALQFDDIEMIGISGIFGVHNDYYSKAHWMVKAYLK